MDTSTMIEAKKEYTTQLQQILSPRIYERFKFIFDGTLQVVQRELAMNQIQSGSVMKIFQKQLSSIKDWNESNIIEEYERIKSRSKCNYLDKLIKAVIIANMKILSTIQYGGARKNRSKIQVHIPTPTHFIHRCYVECAKEIYKNPYIFDMSATLSSKEKHQNLRDSLLIIDNGISSAIRQLLPIGDLLEQNFNSDVEDDDEDERSEESESRRGHRQRGGSVSSSSEEERSEDEETEDDEEEQSEDEGQESDMSSISSSGSEADDEDEDDDEEVSVEGGGSQKSESSISKKSEALASRVESYLEDQTADDIKISIGDDRETQSILANVMEQRAEASQSGGGGSANDPWTPSQTVSYPTPPPAPASSPVYAPLTASTPQPQQSSGGGGFIGALYNTFASSRNMKPNADDVSVPTISNNAPTYTSPGYSTQAPKPEEVKEIVFSGKIPSGFASMPQESPKAPEPPKPTPPPISTPSFQSMVPAINPSYGIYPPKIPTPPSTPSSAQPRPSSYPTKPVQAQAPVPPPSSRPTHMVTRPVKKLSLREQKYGSSTIKPLSGSSHRMSQSSGGGRESDSDDDASFRF